MNVVLMLNMPEYWLWEVPGTINTKYRWAIVKYSTWIKEAIATSWILALLSSSSLKTFYVALASAVIEAG